MKPSPSGFQLTFLLFTAAFAAMLVTRQLAKLIELPPEFFNNLGNLISFPFEVAMVLAFAPVRKLVLEGLRAPLPLGAAREILAVTSVKLNVTFALWGTLAVWGLFIARNDASLESYRFMVDRAARDDYYFSTWGLIGAAMAVSFGPICEEIIYRGALYRLWEKQWGWIAGTLLSASVFAAIHPSNMIGTFVSGILYACLYRRTGSLRASILCHAGFNFLVTWPLLGHVLQVKPGEATTSLAPWIPNLICLPIAIMGVALYVGLAARRPSTN